MSNKYLSFVAKIGVCIRMYREKTLKKDCKKVIGPIVLNG